jgi:DNA-binding PadR family transcriptional regulator
MSRRNPLALAVLSCLIERPMHPYEISTTLRSRGKELSIKLNYGSLYAVVESLRKRGLVSAVETSREGRRPERTVYEITDAGRVEHEDWLAQLLSTPEREFTSLEAGLSLMPGLPPSEVARLLGERAERLRMELRSLDDDRRSRVGRAGSVSDREPLPAGPAHRRTGLRH